MTRVFKSAREWMEFRKGAALSDLSIGFVPTMGALHEGHASLVARSRSENDCTVVSIFVNPTQFNDAQDLQKYPRTWAADLQMLERAGANFVIAPDNAELYPDQYRYRLTENDQSKRLEGAHRPGHFDGMLTVVMKLLQIAGAGRAYFGEKDYQQLELVRGMVQAFFLDVEVIGCPTIRDFDGLALSSRNARLTPEDRKRASAFPLILSSDRSPEEARRALEAEGFAVDYVEDFNGHRFGAVHLGEVRLIDHVQK